MVIEVEVDSACLPHILPQLCAYSSVHFHIKKKKTTNPLHCKGNIFAMQTSQQALGRDGELYRSIGGFVFSFYRP